MDSQPVDRAIEELVWVQLGPAFQVDCDLRFWRLARDVHLHIPRVISGHVVGASPVTC